MIPESNGTERLHLLGELHIDDGAVIEQYKIIAKNVPNGAIKMVRLLAKRGELILQYSENGFRVYELPAPAEGRDISVIGPNGVGKSTAFHIGGLLKPSLGNINDAPMTIAETEP